MATSPDNQLRKTHVIVRMIISINKILASNDWPRWGGEMLMFFSQRIQEQPDGAPNPKGGGAQTYIWPVFTENSMKTKKFGRERRPLRDTRSTTNAMSCSSSTTTEVLHRVWKFSMH